MSSINKLMTKFCVIWTKFIKLYTQRPAVTSQNDISKLQKQLRSVLQSHFDQFANFGSLPINDSKPQGCDQQHKSLKVTWNATNRCKHKMKHPNKLLPTISSKFPVNTRRVCFPIESFVSMASIYEFMTKFCVVWAKLMKLFSQQPLLTSQFDMSNIQKQVRSVIRNHLDQCANFGPLPINVCVTVNHNVLFYSINR